MLRFRPALIMLFGNKCVGKTTSARFIANWLQQKGHPTQLIGFADPIKKIATQAFHLPEDLVHGDDKDKETPTEWPWDQVPGSDRKGLMTIRQFMQFIGTEIFRRNFHPEVWDKIFWRKVRLGRNQQIKPVFICHDGRHHSEMNVPEEFAASTYKILVKRTLPNLQDSHSSENQLAQMAPEMFNKIIINDGGMEELYTKLEEVLVDLY